MKIGISINGVLRNYFKQIETIHTKYFPPEDIENEDGSITEGEPIKVKDYDLEKWVVFPKEETEQVELEFDPEFDPLSSKSIDSIEDLELSKTEEQVTVQEFMYEKCTLEIFGSAEEMVPYAMKTLNDIILEYPEHEFIIMSREGGLSVPSTYFFLSKTSCQCQNVKFVTDSKDHWKYVDVMVTDHPDIINSKPEDKICVIIDKSFNEKVMQSNIRIDSIKDLRDVLEKLKQPVL
jgi:hypothetical protein